MALRITGTPAGVVAPMPREIGARAERALLGGDLDAYARLWKQAGDVPGAQGPYEARVALAEQALRAGATLPAPRVATAYVAAATGLVDALAAEPAEPRLLNLAGVLLYELWALDPAERLFRATLRLDPEHGHAARNLDELRRRRRTPGGAPRLAPAVVRALGPLAARASRVADRAQPAAGRTLTLAMIVRDEEEMLPRCLEAARPFVDEVVVVDTGSTDRTVEIAEGFGARVLHHAWTGSFADARNVSFAAATGDWVMYLDADEVLVAEDGERLRALLGETWREAFHLVETNYTGDEEDGTALVHNALRVFRNRPEYRFDGRLHEQIADKLPTNLPERIARSDVRVEHFGYLARVRTAKDKSNRNLEILRRQIAEAPEPTAFLLYNLGSELAALGDDVGAVEPFADAWSRLLADPRVASAAFGPSLAARYVRSLRVLGWLDEAERSALEGLERYPGHTDLVLALGNIAQARGDDATALARFAECLEIGEGESRYTTVAGAGSFLALQAAAASHRRLGDLAAARAALERALHEHPRYLGTVDPLAQALLADGVAPAEVAARIEAGVGAATPSVRFMLGTALYEAGAAAEAAEQFERVLAARPDSGPARVALAEALLSLGHLDAAADAAAQLDPTDPLAPVAARTAVFSRLAAGEAPAPALLAALTDVDGAAYRAWAAVLRGEDVHALPAAAAETVLTALEALLHLEAYEAFEGLLPVFDRVAVGERERRERLAQLYLRRGFLESAADEWIAASAPHGPDAAALVGLAQVAVARGLADDARALAEGARELAPDDVRAGAVLAALAA